MPTDKVQNRTFKEILNGTVRFEVPFFQRGYAWEKKQWDQLFTDLQEQLISEINDGKAYGDVEHFFGPIVVLEKMGGAVELKEFLVVDGQQRITTIYLLLALIAEQLKAKKQLSPSAYEHIAQINKFLINDVSSSDDYMKMKVFSCKGDRLPTYRMVFGSDANPTTPYLPTDLQLYVPETNKINAFRRHVLRKHGLQHFDVPSLWQLAQVVLNCLKIVWIPLDAQKDDPQAIFESLNDKGMPLSASELLCNYIFRPIIDAKENYEKLHNEQWLATIRLLGDDLFESFLRNLFSIGENKMVGKNRKVYIHFKSKNRSLTSTIAKEHLQTIASCAKLFRSIRDPLAQPHAQEKINTFLINVSHTRMESSTPFILAVLRAHAANKLSESEACRLLRETAVLLVRRKMTELSTTQYDAIFPGLLDKVINETKPVAALHDQFRQQQVWVSDQEFKNAFLTKPAYRIQDLPFSRMLLVEIDRKMQSFGQLPDYSTINTIEHVLPQSIDDAWMMYLKDDATDEHRWALTHTIGNLCLLSGPANSSAGQNPFEAKQKAYSPVCALTRDIMEHPEPWNLSAIRIRSEKLAMLALDVWKWDPS